MLIRHIILAPFQSVTKLYEKEVVRLTSSSCLEQNEWFMGTPLNAILVTWLLHFSAKISGRFGGKKKQKSSKHQLSGPGVMPSPWRWSPRCCPESGFVLDYWYNDNTITTQGLCLPWLQKHNSCLPGFVILRNTYGWIHLIEPFLLLNFMINMRFLYCWKSMLS